MANKVQQIFNILQKLVLELSDVRKWTAFLHSAAWQYKYPFEDQILIYAQRPDATACASLEAWNNKLHRWIKKGSKGIALLREGERGHYLDYVFDISDTSSFRENSVRLWEYNGKYESELIETLENTFGELEHCQDAANAVLSAAHNAVQDSMSDYIHELNYVKYGSFLSALDSVNINTEFVKTAENSVAYVILTRLGFEAENYISLSELQHIRDFNTSDVLAVLGNAVSDISEQALREISKTIRTMERPERNNNRNRQELFEKNKREIYNKSQEKINTLINNERNGENGRIEIHTSGRLSDTGLRYDAESEGRQIRDDEAQISETESQKPVFGNENQRNIDGTSDGYRQYSERTSGETNITDGENRGSGREDESRETDIVVRLDEQSEAFGRRNSNQSINNQLNIFEMFPTEQEQQNIVIEGAVANEHF